MKHFKLKNKGAKLRVVEEPVIQKKKWSFDRIFYLCVLAFISFVVLKFTYKVLNIIKGNGQIIFEKRSINFTTDIRLGKILIKEGEWICEGDTMFHYTIEKKSLSDESVLQKAQVQYKNQNELMGITQDIFKLKNEIEAVKLKLEHANSLYQTEKELVILEVSPKINLSKYKKEKQLLHIQLNQYEKQLKYLYRIRYKMQNIGDELENTFSSNDITLPYLSPITGINGKINFHSQEVCYRQQEVLSIHNPEQVMIKAYFGQKHTASLTEGVKVRVVFEDGTKSVGRITKSYIATHALPSEFQKKYEPTERNILLSIEPLDENSKNIWEKFYLMDAKLKVYRWNPFL